MSVGLALNQPRPNLQLHHFLPDISHSTRSSLNVTTLAHSHRKDTVPPRDTVIRVADGARARARAYKLSASRYRRNERVLSRGKHWSEALWTAFPSTRSGFINRADDHDIKLFCLSNENALSTGVLDTSFICSASSYFCLRLYLPPFSYLSFSLFFLFCFHRFYRVRLSLLSLFFSFLFFLSFLSLVPGSRRYLFLFSFLGPRRRLVPILVGDFRRCSSGPSLDKMHGEQLTRQRNGAKGKRRNMAWQNDTSRLSDTSERSLASDKLLIPKSWPLSPLNPDKERYLARSGTKGPSGLDDPASLLFVHLSLSFFFFTFPFWTRPLFKRLDFPSFFPLCRRPSHFFPALAFFFPWSFLLSFLLDRSPWRRDSASRLSAATYISFLGIAKIRSTRKFLFHRLQIFSCVCRPLAVAALLPYLFAPILCEIAVEELDSRRNENPERRFLAALRTIGRRIRRNKSKLYRSSVNVSRRIFRVSVGCNYSEFRGFLSEVSSWEC